MMMRALGPGSVSSLLKLALDVIAVVLWIGLGALVLAAFAALLFSSLDLSLWRQIVVDAGVRGELQAKGPILAAGILALAAYVGMLLFIINRLRKIFATLTAGDPFHPDNVPRLRSIGFGLAGLEVLKYATALISGLVLKSQLSGVHYSIDLTAWFAVLVVFVLSEVFREGARLRSEAELTV